VKETVTGDNTFDAIKVYSDKTMRHFFDVRSNDLAHVQGE
jgi:hypothetical protein